MACVSAGTWLRTVNPKASISTVNGLCSRTRRCSASVSLSAASSNSSTGMLHCSFLSSSSLSPSFRSPFLGSSLEADFTSNRSPRTGHHLVVRAGRKFQLGQTKRNRSRKSLARTHGFRRRMRTTGGRAILKRRRAKGRWELCPKSNPSGGKRS